MSAVQTDILPARRTPAQQDHFEAGYVAGAYDMMQLLAPPYEPARSAALNKALAVALGRLHGCVGEGRREVGA